MFRRHYSDATLLAWQDGELPAWRRGRIQKHLRECWNCRSRLGRLEEQIRRLSEMAAEAPPSDAGWAAAARGRFRASQAEFEREFRPRFRERFLPRLRWKPALAALAAAAALASVGVQSVRSRVEETVPGPPPAALPRPLLFAPPADAGRDAAQPPPPVLLPPAPPLPAPAFEPLPSGELIAREVEAHYVLHQHRACLGDSVEVLHGNLGRVVVQGVVAGPARLAELTYALAALPFVTTGLRLLPLDAATPYEPPSDALQVRSPAPVLRAELEEYFRSRLPGTQPGRALAAMANNAITLSQDCMAEAWAITRLLEQFPAGRLEQARPASRRLLDDMVRDHALALAQTADHLSRVLEPVASVPGEPGVPPPARGLLEAVTHIDGLVRGLFVGAPLAGSPAQAARSLVDELASVREAARHFDVFSARNNR
jgi:hypothetical protein